MSDLEKAYTKMELACDLSAAWEGLEGAYRMARNEEESARLRARRLAFWQRWDREIPSIYPAGSW